MKTKFLLVSLLLSLAVFTYAQDAQPKYDSGVAGYKTPFKRNGAGDNWFIHLGGGGQIFFGDNDHYADAMNRVTFMPTVAIGKWFSPYWGVRVKAQGGGVHGFENNATFMQKEEYYNVHFNAMWNLSNYWGKYNEEKLFSFIPYGGLGYGHRFENDQVLPAIKGDIPSNYSHYSNVMTVNGGLIFGFRLSNRINLDLDLGAMIVPDYFDRIETKMENEAVLSGTAGITIKLGKTGFTEVEPMNYALINDLNSQINSLRTKNDDLSKRPVSCPECPKAVAPVVVPEVNYVPNVVMFRLNSSKIDENQQVSIYNTAEFMKNTSNKIKVVGYADKNTGSGKYNLGISEKRAKAVAKELTTKYNIPSQNIVIEWRGSDEQPYSQNTWNRVVIMSAQ